VNQLHTPSGIRENLKYISVLLFCCLIAYYPLTFHLFSLKNDALNYFLPVRYQISDAIVNHTAPFWSPYFNLGYPLHGDMQSGVWNPVVQLFSLFGPYTLRMLQWETVLYVFLAGVSMYFLIDYFFKNKQVAFWIGMAYMLCGFNSDSAQFLNWISAASFFPFAFLFYHRMLERRSWKDALFFSFFFYLIFVTAYPADFIISLYVLILLFFYYLYQGRKTLNRSTLVQISKLHIIAIICFTFLSLPAMISYYEFLQLSERGTGTSFEKAMSNPFHPLLLFGYISPLGFWKSNTVEITDPLERNVYFGLIPFLFFAASLFIRSSNKIVIFSKWAVLVTLIFSFGKIGLLRPLAYYTLPLMNTFRHPANARIFTIFFACILSAFALNETQNRNRKANWILFWALPVLLGILLLYAAAVSNFTLFGSSWSFRSAGSLKNRLDQLSFADLTLIDIFIQIPFLVLIYFFFKKRLSLSWLMAAGIVNCMVHTMLFQPFTVVKKDTAQSIQRLINQVARPGFSNPDISVSLAENSKDGMKLFKEIGTGNMYNKKVGRVDYIISPCNLVEQNAFWDNTKLQTQCMQYPLIYKADTAILLSQLDKFNTTARKIAFIGSVATMNWINQHHSDSNNMNVKQFLPQHYEFEVQGNAPAFYVLQQNWYPRWQLSIDGKPTPIEKTNLAFMGLKVPEGKHVISFNYKRQDIIIAFYISLAATLLTMSVGIASLFRSSSLS
jgi:hypothetical protein